MAQSSPIRHRPDKAGREGFVCSVVCDGPSGRCGVKEQCFKEEECVAVGYGETRELEGRTAEADVGEGVNGGEGGEQDKWDLARVQRAQDDICDCVNFGLLESDRSCVGRGVEDMQQSVVCCATRSQTPCLRWSHRWPKQLADKGTAFKFITPSAPTHGGHGSGR